MVKTPKSVQEVIAEQNAEAERARNENTPAKLKSSTAFTDTSNPWLQMGAKLDEVAGMRFLKFTQTGEFEISEHETIPLGTRCVARVSDAEWGWRKWQEGGAPTTRMGRVSDGFIPKRREELGDLDQRQWDMQDGVWRDPWQSTLSLPISRVETGEAYLFSTSSVGGRRAVGGLIRAYGIHVQGNKTGNPVVELGANFYKHKAYGKIYYPIFHITNWVGDDGNPRTLAEDLDDRVPI
jgi:hypothetical protein